MREAEASLSLKEMRQKLAELEQQWAKYVHVRTFEGQNAAAHHLQHPTSSESMPEISGAVNGQNPSPPSSAPQTARGRLAKLTATLIGAASVDNADPNAEGALSVRELEDQLMGVRIREADAVAELKEMRQKVMELETQNHVCTNQLKRQDDEVKRLREQFEQNQASEKVLSDQLKDEKRKSLEVQSELKEKSMMQRLKYSEAMQTIAELRQQISQFSDQFDPRI
uniref:GOLGA2L5 domain-containing protein n=1 Tax=Steinernema glaseri TaxID=37863 RepID=A0A1I7ZK18_9BILA